MIFFSFAGVKAGNMKDMKAMVKIVIANLYGRYREILKSDKFDENDREAFRAVNEKMEDVKAQTAWIGGYWEEAAGFFRSFLTIHSRQIHVCTTELSQELQEFQKKAFFQT